MISYQEASQLEHQFLMFFRNASSFTSSEMYLWYSIYFKISSVFQFKQNILCTFCTWTSVWYMCYLLGSVANTCTKFFENFCIMLQSDQCVYNVITLERIIMILQTCLWSRKSQCVCSK